MVLILYVPATNQRTSHVLSHTHTHTNYLIKRRVFYEVKLTPFLRIFSFFFAKDFARNNTSKIWKITMGPIVTLLQIKETWCMNK